mmetsp:Transcript_15997/g.18073  ORF Transcript_15997/g.18073 Transcript_15997/m.18073 type:complete len:259 (-) Transcript_15997:262-1038(-)
MAAFHDVLSDPNTPLGLVAHSGLSIRWGSLSDAKTRLRRHEDINFVNKDESKEKLSEAELIMHQKTAQGWEFALPGISREWGQWMKAADVQSIIEDYTWRTGGSTWSQSPVTTTWDFRQSDPEWGGIQAKSLEEDLMNALQKVNVPVEVMRKKNTVQLMPKGVSKGTAVTQILKELPERMKDNPPVDFALCIGDDIADERMFSALLDFYRPAGNQKQDDESIGHVYTCTVGRKPTEAQFYLNDTKEVVDLLKQLNDKK